MKKFRKILKEFLVVLVALQSFTACDLLNNTSSKSGNYTLKGTVKDKSGQPVSGVEISVSKGSLFASATSAKDGTYTINHVSGKTLTLSAKKAGYFVVPDYADGGPHTSGYNINVSQVAVGGVVCDVNFKVLDVGTLTIADIQGDSSKSPLAGNQVGNVTGVVTMICKKTPHYNYDTTAITGENVAQYVSEDGFYLEALPEDKDLSGKCSNGIFVSTHDNAYESSKWKDGIPNDLKAGDVVTVSGIVRETYKQNRFYSSAGALTRTVIDADVVAHRIGEMDTTHYSTSVFAKDADRGNVITTRIPDGVLITYSQDVADEWIAAGYLEYRIMPCDDDDLVNAQQHAIDVLETMEDMVITIKNPLVIAGTYYNNTGVLADGGKKGATSSVVAAKGAASGVAGGQNMRTFNERFGCNVITENDYNAELLFVDFQATDWTTFYPLAQTGDYLLDSTDMRVFRGVMDYTGDGLYMAHPLNSIPSAFIQGSSSSYGCPFYTVESGSVVGTSVHGDEIPVQGWNFDCSQAWYNTSDKFTDDLLDKMSSKGLAATKTSSSKIGEVKTLWRTGDKTNDCSSDFKPKWGSQVLDTDTLTVGVFNLENYEAEGGAYSKDIDVSYVIKNNLCYPDVMVIVEMGDDVSTAQIYTNQDNSYALKDGHVSAVKNYSGIIDRISDLGGPQYEFRQIDPKEFDSGGKGGVNIRVGFMYNTERVAFVDTGSLPTNHYSNTHGVKDASGNITYGFDKPILNEADWPLTVPSNMADIVADAKTYPYLGEDNKAHIGQNPCYIHHSSFNRSRRPLVGEFRFTPEKKAAGESDEDYEARLASAENFFVIGCHLSSKRGDYPLYGVIQPPLLLSESKRNQQAEAVHDFVKAILKIEENAKVIVAGDMNEFAYSIPMRVLTGERSNDLILYSPMESLMPRDEQFSYCFNGNYQEIDHMLVSPSIWKKMIEAAEAEHGGDVTGFGAGELSNVSKIDAATLDAARKAADVWSNYCFVPHIDSMFCRNNHVNLSDHDPAIIKLKGAF